MEDCCMISKGINGRFILQHRQENLGDAVSFGPINCGGRVVIFLLFHIKFSIIKVTSAVIIMNHSTSYVYLVFDRRQ